MGLTALTLRKTETRAKPYKLADRDGLYVMVATSGSKLWRFDYRFDGKRKTVSFGPWPVVSIADAHARLAIAKEQLRNAIDPSTGKPLTPPIEKHAQPSDTFEALARDWFANRRGKWVSSYSTRIMSRLEGDIFPVMGTRHPDEIGAPELLLAVRKIEDRGAIELAKRVKNYCGEIFRFGIAESRCQRDPSADIRSALKPKPPTKHRTKLRMRDMPALVRAIAAHRDGTLGGLALKLTTQTVARTQEIRFAEWSEFEGLDGPEPLWRVPPGRMKMRLEHLVPLSSQTAAMLRNDIPRNADRLFASDTKSGVISENAMLNVLYSLGYFGKMTVHGIRGTFSTYANESGLWDKDWVERALAHVDENEVRRAYNAAEYLPQRRQLLQWWNDALGAGDDFADLIG